jgi:hypothetical protein
MTYTLESVTKNAEALLNSFQQTIEAVPYHRKGIFFSEMLFVYAATHDTSCRQIVESGRANGQSTFLLGKLFPHKHIVSIEYDAESPDAERAKERLKGMTNVFQLFGDSHVLLPALVLPGDVVIIDGPKGFGAVDLALHLLAQDKAQAVFIHDSYKGKGHRAFLDQYVPGVFYSDDFDFVKRFSHIDKPCWEITEDATRSIPFDRKIERSSTQSYGPTFACLPKINDVNYKKILYQKDRFRFLYRLNLSIKKRLKQS